MPPQGLRNKTGQGEVLRSFLLDRSASAGAVRTAARARTLPRPGGAAFEQPGVATPGMGKPDPSSPEGPADR